MKVHFCAALQGAYYHIYLCKNNCTLRISVITGAYMNREHRNPGRRSIIRLAALSAVVLSVILAGCGSKDAASKEGNSGDEKVESLTVSHDLRSHIPFLAHTDRTVASMVG